MCGMFGEARVLIGLEVVVNQIVVKWIMIILKTYGTFVNTMIYTNNQETKIMFNLKQALISYPKVLRRWEKIIQNLEDGQEWRADTEECNFCSVFIRRTPSCKGCPIKYDTGKGWCWGTPYHTGWDIDWAFEEYMYLLNIGYAYNLHT